MASSQSGRRNAHGPRYKIKNPEVLQALIRDLIAAEYGSVEAAARRTKIDRSTWYRLLSGKHSGLAQQVAYHLQRLISSSLGSAGYKRFLTAMTYPGAERMMRTYQRWAHERQERHFRRSGDLWKRSMDGLSSRVIGRAEKRMVRNRLASELEVHISAEVPEYKKFEQWMTARWFDRNRILVAKMRILEPFLDFAESGFIEMAWQELPASQRRRHVRTAIERERWLLQRRGPAAIRAEEIVHPEPPGPKESRR